MNLKPVMIGVLGLCLVATAAQATDGETWTWSRSMAADESFAVETPCNAFEVDKFTSIVGDMNGQQFDPDSKIVCKRSGMVLTAGIVTAPEVESFDTPIFDVVAAMVGKGVRDSVSIKITEVSGRRAIVSRETKEGITSQTGVIEISDRRLLMILSGGPMEEGVAPEAVGGLIDRYFASVEVLMP